MKKLVMILLAMSCFFVGVTHAESMTLEYDGGVHQYSGDVYELEINDSRLVNLPLQPIIFNERAMVPVREVFESLGATVNYYGEDQSIVIGYEGKVVEMKIGSTLAMVDGIAKTIPGEVAPKLIAKSGENPKTMVPVRFISESIGLAVGFDGEAKVISISDGKNNFSPLPPQENTEVVAGPVINKFDYKIDGEVVTLSVCATAEISNISEPVITGTGVLYIDVYGASHAVENVVVELGVVKGIRVGAHEGFTRIALDTQGMARFNVDLSEDNKAVVFKITGNGTIDLDVNHINFDELKPVVPVTPNDKVPEIDPLSFEVINYNPNKIVVIDAGHGGKDPGASSYLMTDAEKQAYYAALASPDPLIASMSHGSGQKYNEKDIALAVAHKVRQNLEASGINVIMTRDGDTYPSLDSRPALANEQGAVIFVSIHLNATATQVTGAKGIEIYYSEENNGNALNVTSRELATEILNKTIEYTGAKSRGVKTGNLLVNRKCLMPSALVEIGFMNNPDELALMADAGYQDKIAAGITAGIISAYGRIMLP